jgi:hypothetical protein
MTLAILAVAMVLVACAATIYRLSGEVRDLTDIIRVQDADIQYLRERTRRTQTASSTASSGVLCHDVPSTLPTTQTLSTGSLAAPFKRKAKAIRGKRKP